MTLALGAAGGICTGCAPATYQRPMVPLMPGQRAEMGAALNRVGPRPVGQDEPAWGGQAWGTYQPVTWFDVSLVGTFSEGISAGLAMRWRAIESDNFAAGLGAELGVGWAALNLPFSVRVQDRVWMYSAPQYGSWGFDDTVRLPLGVDVRVGDMVHVRGEAQLNYPDFDVFKRRVHMGLGVALRL